MIFLIEEQFSVGYFFISIYFFSFALLSKKTENDFPGPSKARKNDWSKICVKMFFTLEDNNRLRKLIMFPLQQVLVKFLLISNRYLVLIPAKIKRPLSQPVYTNYYYNLGKKCHQSRLEAKLAKIEEFFQNFILQSGMAINCFIIRLLEWPRSWRFTTIF